MDNNNADTGWAKLSAALLMVWGYLPEHHLRVLPLILSFAPNPMPGQGTLAEMAHCSRQSINNAISQMKDAGLLTATRRQKENGGDTSCLYALANVDDAATRERVIAWYVEHHPDSPGARARRKACSILNTCSILKQPLSSPRVDTPCQVLGFTPPVKSKGLHPPVKSKGLHEETRDKRPPKTQGQENTRAAADATARGPVAAAPGLPPADPNGSQSEGGPTAVPQSPKGHGEASTDPFGGVPACPPRPVGHAGPDGGPFGMPTADRFTLPARAAQPEALRAGPPSTFTTPGAGFSFNDLPDDPLDEFLRRSEPFDGLRLVN